MSMQITSSAFGEGGSIPGRHTCDGEDTSPPLTWEGGPEGVGSYALICDDPDAPVGTWVHWVIYGISPEVRALAEAVPATEAAPGGAKQGINDFRRLGYGGPCPPPGSPHRYFFKLYALDGEPELGPRASKAELLQAMEGHILAEAELMGVYQRE